MLSIDFLPNTGGIAAHVYELSKALVKQGNDVQVITLRRGFHDKKYQEIDGIKVYRVYYPRLRVIGFFVYSFLAWLKLRMLVRGGVERSHAFIWFPDGVTCLLAFKTLRIPYFVTVHASEILPKYTSLEGFIFKKLMSLVLSNARAIIAVSQFTKSKLIDCGVEPEKIVVIPNGTDPLRFNPKVDPIESVQRFDLLGKRVILTVGGLVERKGHDMVIKSLPQVLKEVPNAVYLIVGEGQELSRLKELVTALDLENCVLFVGRVGDDELPKYYNACDVFIMPSREITETGDAEGFGIVYLEANACGKPVIGGRAGGVPGAILDGVTGFLVNPLSAEEISEALIKLLQNNELAVKLGVNGRRRVEEELNWDIIANKVQQVYYQRL